jgi:hypothetical protein
VQLLMSQVVLLVVSPPLMSTYQLFHNTFICHDEVVKK